MVRTTTFWVACAILALVIIGFGCGGTSQPKVETPASPTPTAKLSPTLEKHFRDYEMAKFQKDFARISAEDADVLKQVSETDSKSGAMRRAYADFATAESLEKVRWDPTFGKELDFFSPEEATALADKRLLSFGTWALQASRDSKEFPWMTTNDGKDAAMLNEDSMLYLLSEKMSARNLLLKEIGTTPQELRSLALSAARDFGALIKEDLREKDDDPLDDYSPLKSTQDEWKAWKNPWGFSPQQIGLSDKEVILLYGH